MTVGELLARISSAELTEWIAYEEMSGSLLGPERADMHAGVLAATVANNNPNRKRGARKAKPTDFMPEWDGNRELTADEQVEQAKRLNRRMGGTTGRYGRPVDGATDPPPGEQLNSG